MPVNRKKIPVFLPQNLGQRVVLGLAKVALVAVGFGLWVGMGAGAAYAVTPAGTQINAQGIAIYEDVAGNEYSVKSNITAVEVQQVFSATMRGAAHKFVPAGGQVNFPFVITNTGNGADEITLTIAWQWSDATNPYDELQFSGVGVYVDENGNGIADVGEPKWNLNGTQSLAAGQALDLVFSGQLPVGSVGERAGIQIGFKDSQDEHVKDISPVVGVVDARGTEISAGDIRIKFMATISNDAIINVTNDTVHDEAAKTITQTITITNVGAVDAYDVVVSSGRSQDQMAEFGLPAAWVHAPITSYTATGFGASVDPSDISPTLSETRMGTNLKEPDLGLDLNGDGDLDDQGESGTGIDFDSSQYPTFQAAWINGSLGGVYGLDNVLSAGASVTLTIVRDYTEMKTDQAASTTSYWPYTGIVPAGFLISTQAHVSWDSDDDGDNLSDNFASSNITVDEVPQNYDVLIRSTDVGEGPLNDGGDDTSEGFTASVSSIKSGEASLHKFIITNNGNATDTFDLNIVATSATPHTAAEVPEGIGFSLWDETNQIPLLDTDGEGTVDTGPLSAGEQRTIMVRAQFPAGFTTDTRSFFVITASSDGVIIPDYTVSEWHATWVDPNADFRNVFAIGTVLEIIENTVSNLSYGIDFSGFNPNAPASGPGSCGTGAAFTSLKDAKTVINKGRYCFDLGAGEFLADVDTAEGGGWVLILQYINAPGSSPALNAIGANSDLPQTSSVALGDADLDPARTGHTGNAAVQQFFDAGTTDIETRWYGRTVAHDRTIHFYTTEGDDYMRTGTGNFHGAATNYVALTGHAANATIPNANGVGGAGDQALVNHSFRFGHWLITYTSALFYDVDSVENPRDQATHHRVWIRDNSPEDSPSAGIDFSGFNPNAPATGPGSVSQPFTTLAQAKLVQYKGRYVFDLGDGPFLADVDTAEGGGWVLVLQYIHQGGTNPSQTVIGATVNLPATSNAILGDDEGFNATTWGHAGNAAVQQFFDAGTTDIETRWYGQNSDNNRVIHFYSTVGDECMRSATSNFTGIENNHTLLTGHTGYLPAASNPTTAVLCSADYAFNHAMGVVNYNGIASIQWNIANGGKWYAENGSTVNASDTHHRVWIRDNSPEDSPSAGIDFSGFNPTPPALGPGSAALPFTSLADAKTVTRKGRYVFDLGDGSFLADVDTAEGGGWVLVLQYVHQSGTNPALNVIEGTADLPATSNATLGYDESASTTSWGHTGNAAIQQFFDAGTTDIETRWHGQTSVHNRIIHFYSTVGDDYMRTGTGSFDGIQTDFTALTGHTANAPAGSVETGSVWGVNQGNNAIADHPFYGGLDKAHWNIGREGVNRWDMDEVSPGSPEDTQHRVWIRDTAAPVAANVERGISAYVEGDVGETVSLPVVVRNNGNSSENYRLSHGARYIAQTLEDLPNGWTARFTDLDGRTIYNTSLIPPGGAWEGRLVVDIPTQGPPRHNNTTTQVIDDAGTTNIDANYDDDADYPIYVKATGVISGQVQLIWAAVDVNITVNTLQGQPNANVRPGGFIDLPFTYEHYNDWGNIIPTAVLDDPDWTTAIWVDTDGDGVVDTLFDTMAQNDPVFVLEDGQPRTAMLDSSGAIPLNPNYETLKFVVRVFAPTDAAAGAASILEVTPSGSVAPVPMAKSIITVVTDTVQLSKTSAADAGCAGAATVDLGPDANFAEIAQGAGPGDCVIWQVVATNLGTEAATSSIIRDTVPPFTTYKAGTLRACVGDAGLTTPPACTFSMFTDATGDDSGEASDGAIAFDPSLGGTPLLSGGDLAPNQSLTVRYATEVE